VNRDVSGRALAVALLGVLAGFVGCGGSSKSQSAPAGGTANDAGRGGASATGGRNATGGSTTGGVGGSQGGRAGGAGRSAGGTQAGTSGAGGASGTPSGGTAGSGGGLGGSAGEDVSPGGEGSDAGNGGAAPCRDLCVAGAPECCLPALRCVETVPSCRIDVLSENLGVVYDYAELEAEVATLSPDFIVSIADEDIAWAATDPLASERFEFRLDAAASVLHGAVLSTIHGHPFLLSCDERVLFVGLGYMREGAAAIRTPVLHVEEASNGAVTLLLGAYQGAWYGFGSGNGDLVLRERIDRPELRTALCARGILNKL
jgi:hypothetical protein